MKMARRLGISPVLATLILIVIAVVAGIIVFAWVSGWMGGRLGAGEVGLNIEHVSVEKGRISIVVRNTGRTKITITDVTVEDITWSGLAYAVDVGATTTIELPYAWTYKQSYRIRVSTDIGASIEGTYSTDYYETPYALQFDGTDDTVSTSHKGDLSLTRFTVELWFKPLAVPGGYAMIISKGESGAWYERNYALFAHNVGGSLKIHYSYGSDTDDSYHSWDSTGSLQLNKWYHVVFTYDGSYARLYINGKLDSERSDTATPDANGQPLYLGGSPDWAPAQAVIDEVRIYNRALSADEVVDNMKGKITTSGLVLWWRLDEGSGNMVEDVTGKGHTGSLGSGGQAPTWTDGITEEVVPPTLFLTAYIDLGLVLPVRRW